MNKLRADHHFVIGHEHVQQGKPCQDHALSFSDDRTAVIVISDGCSSGGETDMGARVMTFGTLAAIRESAWKITLGDQWNVPEELEKKQQMLLGEAGVRFGLSRNDLLATCGYAVLSERGGFIRLFGDGVVAMTYKSGERYLFRYDWKDNMPFYPLYAWEKDSCAFVSAHGGNPEALVLSEESWCTPEHGGDLEHRHTQLLSIKNGMKGVMWRFGPLAGSSTIESIALFTDGVTRIEGVDWKDAVCDLLDFKNTTGEFVKRRMNRALKDYRKSGNGPLDDLAYAVITATHETEKGGCDGSTDATQESGT